MSQPAESFRRTAFCPPRFVVDPCREPRPVPRLEQATPVSYRVERGVPMLSPSRYKQPGITAVLRSLHVGDSIFVGRPIPGLSSTGYNLRPLRFARRKVTEGGITGTRIWRIA